MRLFINGTTQLIQIANAFHGIYPFLKLQFYKPVNTVANSFHKVEDLHRSLIDLDCIIPDSDVSIQFWQTTDVVEKLLSVHTGLKVEVFRKYDDKWIRTDGSDDLTLEEQNLLGAVSGKNQSDAFNQPPY